MFEYDYRLLVFLWERFNEVATDMLAIFFFIFLLNVMINMSFLVKPVKFRVINSDVVKVITRVGLQG